MTLDHALRILAQLYTAKDDVMGFVVHMGGVRSLGTGITHGEHMQAWKTVRDHLRLQTEPKALPPHPKSESTP